MGKKNKKAEKPELTERERLKRERKMEFLRYLITGTATTVINWGVAALLKELLNISGGLNSVISWIVSVVFFAFWGYKLFVFRSKTMEKKTVFYEFIGFVSARLLTLFVEWAFMEIFNKALGFDQTVRIGFTRLVDGVETGSLAVNVGEFYICKFFATVLVTILNYIFSKLLVFSRNNPFLKHIGHKLAEGGEDEDQSESESGSGNESESINENKG